MFIAAIPHPLAAALRLDEAGVAKDLQVVRNRWLRETDAGFDITRAEADGFADGAFAFRAEHAQNATSSGIGEGAELFGEMTVTIARIHTHQYRYGARGTR